MGAVSIRKTNRLIISSALSIVLLTITLSIMLSNSDQHFLLNSSAQAQTFENNTDSVIIPNNIRLNLSELFTRVESSVLQVTDPSTPGLLGPRLGSGFVYDKEGHIITNNHVIAGGSGDLDITFLDGTVYDARLVGSDPYADLAVLKVEEDVPRDKLVPLPLGNSSTLKIGQPVAAIGSPFGLSGSITEGIISGLGRSLPSSIPQDPTIPQLEVPLLPPPPAFSIPDIIQTDAAINPGNSGGPLLNMRGEVVGINTAIFSNTGGNVGIGFAIPTNLVKGLVPQLKDKGKIVRGYLGTVIQRVTPELAETLGLKSPRGALVAEVGKDGPAERAGIRAGDVIVEFNGKEVKDSTDLPLQVAGVAPGKTVQIKILRDSKEMSLPITVGEMQE